jgi:Arc/MetJ family transcription regulator
MRLRKGGKPTLPRMHHLTIQVDDLLLQAIEAYAFLHGCTLEAAAVGAIYHALVKQSVRRKVEPALDSAVSGALDASES